MEYKVIEVKSYSEQTYGKWNSHRTTFLVEGNPNILSAFVKSPLTVGATLSGEIKPVEKDGKTYHNFEFTRKSESGPSDEKIEMILNRLVGMSLRIESIHAAVVPKKEKPSLNGPTAFDEDFNIVPPVDENGIPF